MFYAFGFEQVGVIMSDLYFVDPNPGTGQEGPEHGVRLELRMLDREMLKGSIYSAQPITVGRPIWRVDLLESVAGAPGSFDRTHHHPRFREWEPGQRHFVEELSADPIDWVAGRLKDLEVLLEEAGVDRAEVDAADVAGLRQAVPEITEALGRLLDGVRAGRLGRAPTANPTDEELNSARVGWL